tara:strand:- start:1054 stop:1437 length:384 start_codon:yes stop_codon:yes gene_type:complete
MSIELGDKVCFYDIDTLHVGTLVADNHGWCNVEYKFNNEVFIHRAKKDTLIEYVETTTIEERILKEETVTADKKKKIDWLLYKSTEFFKLLVTADASEPTFRENRIDLCIATANEFWDKIHKGVAAE